MRRPTRKIGATLALAATAGAFMALGGGSASAGTASSPQAQIDAFTACMKQHGIDVHVAIASAAVGPATAPLPAAPPGATVTAGTIAVASGATTIQAGTASVGTPPAGLQDASTACNALLPAPVPPTPAEQAAMAREAATFTACMTAHGAPVPPPPTAGGGTNGQTTTSGVVEATPLSSADAAAMDAALKACAPAGGSIVVSGSGPVAGAAGEASLVIAAP